MILITKPATIHSIIVVSLLLFFTSCNSPVNENASTSTDSLHRDSMPVVRPPISDSSAVVITPPVNDSNVVIPDTTGKK